MADLPSTRRRRSHPPEDVDDGDVELGGLPIEDGCRQPEMSECLDIQIDGGAGDEAVPEGEDPHDWGVEVAAFVGVSDVALDDDPVPFGHDVSHCEAPVG